MVEGDAARFRPKVLPGAALVPLHDPEVLQPTAKGCVSPGIGRISWSAMQEEQRRVVAVLAANRDPLLDSADLDVGGFVDSVRGGNCIGPRIALAQELERRFQLLEFGCFGSPGQYFLRAARTECAAAKEQDRDGGDVDNAADEAQSHSGVLAERNHLVFLSESLAKVGAEALRGTAIKRSRSPT